MEGDPPEAVLDGTFFDRLGLTAFKGLWEKLTEAQDQHIRNLEQAMQVTQGISREYGKKNIKAWSEQAKTYENCIDMNPPGMIRVSFGIYNTEDEVDQFLKILESVLEASRVATKADVLAVPEY